MRSPLLPLVAFDDPCLDLHRARRSRFPSVTSRPGAGRGVRSMRFSRRLASQETAFHDSRRPRSCFSRAGRVSQKRQIGEDQRRLMKRTRRGSCRAGRLTPVFPPTLLSTMESRVVGNLDESDPPHVGGRGEARGVADRAAPERDHEARSVEARLRHGAHGPLPRARGLGRLAVGQEKGPATCETGLLESASQGPAHEGPSPRVEDTTIPSAPVSEAAIAVRAPFSSTLTDARRRREPGPRPRALVS